MLEKDEDYRRRELALQERHSRELAKKSQASAEEMMARPGEEEEQGGSPEGGVRRGADEPGRGGKSSKARGRRSRSDSRQGSAAAHGCGVIDARDNWRYEILCLDLWFCLAATNAPSCAPPRGRTSPRS